MPPSEKQNVEVSDDQQTVKGYQEIVATLIRSLIGVPGFPASYRDRLYSYISEVKKVKEPAALSALPKQIEDLCSSAVAEIDAQGGLKKQEVEIRRIVGMLGESIRSMAEVNASTGTSLDTHMDDLQRAMVENGEPVEFSKKIEAIAESIRKTTRILTDEVEQSRSQVKNAGEKIQTLEEQLQETRAETLRDGLTGLENRRSFNQFITRALSSFDPQEPWCAIMLDVDHFKKVNDTHGHIIGDALLIKLSRALRNEVASPSYLARYGGEEFIIMMPAASLDEAAHFCQSVLHKIKNSRWLYRSRVKEITISATLSAGVAAQNETDTPETIVARADRALYLAKENGRNRFQTEKDLT